MIDHTKNPYEWLIQERDRIRDAHAGHVPNLSFGRVVEREDGEGRCFPSFDIWLSDHGPRGIGVRWVGMDARDLANPDEAAVRAELDAVVSDQVETLIELGLVIQDADGQPCHPSTLHKPR